MAILNPLKVLVVDDDDDIRQIIRYILEMEGLEVSELANGRNYEQAIRGINPDLILMDVKLGDYDGRDICKQLKNQPATQSIPIIIVSATHGWHTAHQKQCGANDYLEKPFDMDELIWMVKRYLGCR